MMTLFHINCLTTFVIQSTLATQLETLAEKTCHAHAQGIDWDFTGTGDGPRAVDFHFELCSKRDCNDQTGKMTDANAVSYTHLTLPTIHLV